MVSQPDHHSTMTIRGPSSVVHAPSSRPSFSRTKRYNRSHAGGSSYVPQNEFPVFSNSGDVEILVRTAGGEHTSRYLLHRDTLTRCSGFFEASTSDEWSRAKTLTAGDEVARIGENLVSDGRELGPVRKRWRYELDWGDDGTDIPMLMQKDEEAPKLDTTQSLFGGPDALAGGTSRKQSSSASNHSFFRSVANLSLTTASRHSRHPSTSQTDVMVPTHLSQQDQDVLRDYDNMLRIFYNYSPVLDSISIADAYVQCKSLLTLADQYDALAVVGPRVDHHLLQFQSRLWKQVAKYPISYLRLGYLAHSRIIFQEALIHVVGQWPAGERSIRSALPESVVELILDKVDDLEEAVSRAETRLFRLGLSTARGERVTPQNGYLDWLALSLFRQWLADNTAPPPAPAPTPGSAGSTTSGSGRGSRHGQRGSSQAVQKSVMTTIPPLAALGRAYRVLGSNSSSAYLTHDECKRFLKLSPELYSRDNLRRFEKRIEELKSQARDIVRPLMGSSLELDAAAGGEGGRAPGNGLGYLTCTRVQEGEMPWGEEYAGLIA